MTSRLDIIRRSIEAAGFKRLGKETHRYVATPPRLYGGDPLPIIAYIIPGRQPGILRYEFNVANNTTTLFGLCDASELIDKVNIARVKFEMDDFFGDADA